MTLQQLRVPPEKAFHADKQSRKRCSKRKAILLAAVICVLLTSLMTVQAAGIDVFGSIARWTTELFSFGKTEERSGLVVDGKWPEIDEKQNLQFTSLQDALDFYGVTEVIAPRWIPPGFIQEKVTVEPNGEWLAFSAEYTSNNSGDLLVVDYNSYNSMPPNYYEKLGEPPESFVINKTTYDIVSNSGNSTAAWTTPHFECFVSVSTDIEVLRRIISSMQ